MKSTMTRTDDSLSRLAHSLKGSNGHRNGVLEEGSTPIRELVLIDGDRVVFRPERGTSRPGVAKFDFENRDGFAFILLKGDPYPVYIPLGQITRKGKEMQEPEAPRRRKTTRTPVKTVEPVAETSQESPAPRKAIKKAPTKRKAAKAPAPVKKAPAPVKKAPAKTIAKKAPARKVVARNRPGPKAAERPIENPFRPGSNSFHYTEALKSGGRRSVLVRRLMKKIDIHPWDGSDPEDVFTEIDKRLTMVAKQLEKTFHWNVERNGRGSESRISASPPSHTNGSRKKAAKKTTAKRRAA